VAGFVSGAGDCGPELVGMAASCAFCEGGENCSVELSCLVWTDYGFDGEC
jgi:hypothetical protein